MAGSAVDEGVAVGGIGVDVGAGEDVAVGDRVGSGVSVAAWVGASAAGTGWAGTADAACGGAAGVGVIRLQPASSIKQKARIQTHKPMRKRDTSWLHNDRFPNADTWAYSNAHGIIARPPASCPAAPKAASRPASALTAIDSRPPLCYNRTLIE